MPTARPLSPNHWGEGSGSWHQVRMKKRWVAGPGQLGVQEEKNIGQGEKQKGRETFKGCGGWSRAKKSRPKKCNRPHGRIHRYGLDTWVAKDAGDIGDNEPARSGPSVREIGEWSSCRWVTSDQDIGERQSWRGVSSRGDIGATALAVDVTSDGDIGEQEAARVTDDVRDMGDGGASVWAHAMAEDQGRTAARRASFVGSVVLKMTGSW